MAKDYVRRTKPKSKTTTRAKKSTGSGRGRAPAPRRLPILPVLLLVMVASALGYLIHIIKGAADQRPVTPAAVVSTQKTASGAAKPNPAPVNPIDQKPVEKWTYIQQLENKEVVVKLPEAQQSTQRYLLQCGSFKSAGQAEQVKAKIAFQGLSSQVRHSSGSVWYRVVLGPYDSQRVAEQDKHKLIKARAVGDCAIANWQG
ncbi:SPOR domain-containing protein [Oceanisphaera sp. W20_SRM_FM3]|uniref:SPOR domain-containing protein n=1 Tax=Oceanisphaera sp. W20_SRM_FM3 TaxID=3240267 RepID=UPI003F987562